MKNIIVHLHPDSVYDNNNLNIIGVKDFHQDTVYSAIHDRYNVEKRSFHYENDTDSSGSGGFTTIEGNGNVFQWVFETLEV